MSWCELVEHSGSGPGTLSAGSVSVVVVVAASDGKGLGREIEDGWEVVPRVGLEHAEGGGGTKSAGDFAKALTGVLCS